MLVLALEEAVQERPAPHEPSQQGAAMGMSFMLIMTNDAMLSTFLSIFGNLSTSS